MPVIPLFSAFCKRKSRREHSDVRNGDLIVGFVEFSLQRGVVFDHDRSAPVLEVEQRNQTARLFVEGVEVFVPSPAAEDWMAEQLHGALAEISDVSLPWKRTAEPETCQYCPFKLICGK